jgi:hypothetical protein
MGREQVGHLLIELAEVILDQTTSFKRYAGSHDEALGGALRGDLPASAACSPALARPVASR